MNRRAFLKRGERISLGVVGCGLASWMTGCTRLIYAPYHEESGRLVVERTVFDASEFVLVEYPQLSNPIYLRRLEENEYVALLLRCTHRGCQPNPAGDRLACPCHGSQYSTTGDVLQGPAERPLTRYDVAVEGSRIFIDIQENP